jgi:hypothetical protein
VTTAFFPLERRKSKSVFRHRNKTRGTGMSAPSAIQHRKKMLRRWFGANRGTHWIVAGSVAVVIFGSYLVYNNRDRPPATAAIIPAADGLRLQ